MSYTSNPHIGKTRRLAVNDVIYGRKTKAEAGRYYGVHRSTIGKWIKRATKDPKKYINTESSKPKRHPKQISIELEILIINLRK